ncbi:MAG: hypothetical protein PVH29_01990 [Candidatus Zixiibacteriota bacterium]|jgi:phosphomannomutase
MDRIQGTDGIRRDVRRQDDPSLAGLSPAEAFNEKAVITDAFLEGYAYAFARLCLAGEPPSREIVVGWDPRDPKGDFTGAVVRGLRKGGATAVVMAVAPTPAVPMFMAYRGAAAGLMITASHNPAGQNGVKIFLAPAGLKLLPADDRELTAAVRALDWEAVKAAPLSGDEVDARGDWRRVFDAFHKAPDNAWLEPAEKPLADFALVVDPARGSYSAVAAELLAAFGADVYEANADDGEGRVNWRSGVADLEGVAAITAEDLRAGGRFADYPALAKLAALAEETDEGRVLAGTVFDADGDRFFLVVYDARHSPTGQDGEFVVLSGDEVATLQAAEMARRLGGKVEGRAFLNTVESDLAVAGAAAALGYEPQLKPVGDKWILTEAWRRAAGIPASPDESGAALSARLAPAFRAGELPKAAEVSYGVGCEETGHAITFGDLTTASGASVPFAAGNGLKSALNTLAAIVALKKELSPGDLYNRLRAPFERGYKSNNYVFYTRKEALLPGKAVFELMDGEIEAAARRDAPALSWRKLHFEEEPELLYWAGYEGERQVMGLFVRNSGTEDKSALYVRAERPWAELAAAMAERLYPTFYAAIKDTDDRRARAELAWLAGGPAPAGDELKRVVTLVEGLMAGGGITPRGEAVLTALRRAKKL